MKMLFMVPVFVLACATLGGCASTPAEPTTVVERNQNNRAERIADHMGSRFDHR